MMNQYGKKRGRKKRRFNLRAKFCLFLIVVVTLLYGWSRSLINVLSHGSENRGKSWSEINPSHVINKIHDENAKVLSSKERGLDGISKAYPVYGTEVRWGEERKIQAVYALPPPLSNKKDIKGIILLLHACTHNAYKFFSSSDSCESCLGLSEELRITRLVLSRGYAALAVTCQNTKSGCWSDADLTPLKTSLEMFQNQISNSYDKRIPSERIFAIGASSGGHMAAKVTAEGLTAAGLVMVMGLRDPLIKRLSSLQKKKRPIFLAPMPRDKGTTTRATKNYEALQQASVPVILDTSTCVPLSVSSAYLLDRVPSMTSKAAEMIVKSLLDANHLDSTTHLLIVDPTKSDWREILKKIPFHENESSNRMIKMGNENHDDGSYLWGQFLLTPGKSPLAKALHRAWAFHEYCSEVVDEALDFFEGQLTF